MVSPPSFGILLTSKKVVHRGDGQPIFFMKYFLHHTNSFSDEKVSELFMAHGYEGVGLYWTIVEKIALAEKPIKTSVLKHQLKVGKKLQKIWEFLESLEMISSNNGETFEEECLNNAEKYKKKSEKTAKRVSQFRENQDIAKNVTRYNSVTESSKLNKTKLNESIDNTNDKETATRFTRPTKDDVQEFAHEESIGSFNAPDDFIDHYESNGWKVGRNSMKNWKAAFRKWCKNEKNGTYQQVNQGQRHETKTEQNDRLYRDFGKELTGGKPLPDIFELCRDSEIKR
jgi:hypothetical protein